MRIDITKKTKELKALISQYETISFVTQYYYLLNTHLRSGFKILELKSPLRQIMYLLSLFLDSNPTGSKIFDPITGNTMEIENLLEEIEAGYRYNFIEGIKQTDLNKEFINNNILVANNTFLNYFVNGELNFVEQEIDKIKRIFTPFEKYIFQKTGLTVDDYIRFYEATDYIEHYKTEQYTNEINRPELYEVIIEANIKDKISYEKFEILFNAIETALYKLPISIELLHKMIGEEKTETLLNIFSCNRESTDNLLYYTDDHILLKKPVVRLNDDLIILPCQKQLIHSIHRFLFEVCKSSNSVKDKVLRAKDKALETKIFEIFEDFFDGKAEIFTNYYIDNEEKDLLVLYRGVALIIECKANKYREPLRDPIKAFERIKDDFNRSIQKGYDQSWAVKNKFNTYRVFEIYDAKNNVIKNINTNKYICYSIIVTSDRFGPIQCDLGLLLKLKENDNYPWSVCVDDLETFLLTLKRKNTFFGEFRTYLTVREKLHGRLATFDELELCSYFLMQKRDFIAICNQIDKVFISSPDMHQLFDDLYQTGIGFKDERNLNIKIKNGDHSLAKRLKLKTPTIIRNYMRTNNH